MKYIEFNRVKSSFTQAMSCATISLGQGSSLRQGHIHVTVVSHLQQLVLQPAAAAIGLTQPQSQ
jgi:hypothetical protein